MNKFKLGERTAKQFPLAEIPHAALRLKHMKESKAVAIKGSNLITILERQ